MDKYGIVLENVSLKNLSTINIGGTAKYLVRPYSYVDLTKLLDYLKENNMKYYILGNASNVLLDDSYFDGVIIKLDEFNTIDIDGNIVTAGAGVMLPKLVNVCLQKELVSLAPFSMIPGTVGGSVVGNAGAYGHEIMEYVKEVKVIDKDNKIKTLTKDDISFGYRYTSLKDNYIVLSVTFICEKGNPIEVLSDIGTRNEKRKDTQPLDKPNVGSIFRNPDDIAAGRLIEELGFKGTKIGGAVVSEKHANFIINDGDATFDDVIKLIDKIKKEAKEKRNIDLVCEPTIVRWN